MDFLQKYVYSVFELPLPRNAQKRTKKKVKEKNSRMAGGGRVWDLANARGGLSIFFFRPLVARCQGATKKKKRRTYLPTFFAKNLKKQVRFFYRIFEKNVTQKKSRKSRFWTFG
jgi:hypothetical protein